MARARARRRRDSFRFSAQKTGSPMYKENERPAGCRRSGMVVGSESGMGAIRVSWRCHGAARLAGGDAA